MENETAEELIQTKVVKGRCFYVPDAGHHLYVENPKQCVANILCETHDQAVSYKFLDIYQHSEV